MLFSLSLIELNDCILFSINENEEKEKNQEFISLNSHAYEISEKVRMHWNKITKFVIQNELVTVDRTTWITKNDTSLEYQVDSLGYPM